MDSNYYSHFSSEDEFSPTCTATAPASHIYFWNEELQDWLNGMDNCYFWEKNDINYNDLHCVGIVIESVIVSVDSPKSLCIMCKQVTLLMVQYLTSTKVSTATAEILL